MLRIVLLAVYLVGVNCQEALLDSAWQMFQTTHHKVYKPSELAFRRRIWEKNVARVQMHNLQFDMGKTTFTMGINEYSDLTWDEYQKYLLGARPPPSGKRLNSSETLTSPSRHDLMSLPQHVDWRDKGYVTPIKNQGQCGSCWAFSSTGALEGQNKRYTGNLISLSEQNLVDCAKGNAGCGGGWMDTAFSYVEKNGGIDQEGYYTYEAKDDTCRYNPSTWGARCTGYADIEKGSEKALQAASAREGPISVAIDAAHQSFQQYKSGVYYEPNCSSTSTDHAVLVVGYGSEDGQDYWLVKNSWGTSWGMKGYIKMARNRKNHCAIASYATFPLVP